MGKGPLFDICVIGAGSGGLSVAAGAAAFGQKVVLIEKGEMGGDCLNYGCVPSKALIAAARHAYGFSSGAPFGITPQKPEIDFQKVHDHVTGVIETIAPHDSQARFEGLGVRVIRAAGRFTGRETLKAGSETITARRFVIATGSSPAAPPIPGLGNVPYFTNETIFANTQLPESLIVIGGGPIGMEMAQAHARLGSSVTVLEAFDPLGKDDPECTSVVLAQLESEGIEILPRIKIEDMEKTASGIRVSISSESGARQLEASHLLVAAGRVANVENLGLEAAGIEYSRRGIKVDKGLKTTNRKVYAIGDVAGGLQFTHVAGYQAGLVLKNALFHLPVT
ncbi:MAG TPA: dihydrolipoamide dehydrogenase, partial [Rhizobiales bacterium]|nr:dihydrolipoamide dehydrogenase [Hyphomicrobiales bacterium]